MRIESKNLEKLPPGSTIMTWPKKVENMEGRLVEVVVVLWKDKSGQRAGYFNQACDYIGEAVLG